MILTFNYRGCQPSRKGSLITSNQQINLSRSGLRILTPELHRLNRIGILRTSFSFHDMMWCRFAISPNQNTCFLYRSTVPFYYMMNTLAAGEREIRQWWQRRELDIPCEMILLENDMKWMAYMSWNRSYLTGTGTVGSKRNCMNMNIFKNQSAIQGQQNTWGLSFVHCRHLLSFWV